MSTQALTFAGSTSTGIRAWIGRMWSFNRLLTLSVLLYVALIPIYVIAAIVDPRIITGAPAFVKPLKFILSTAIYLVTFLWLLSLVQGRRRLVAVLAFVTALGMMVENVIITYQALRGVTSHYNMTTSFDAALFNIMGMIIMLVALMNLGLGILLLFQKLPNRATAWAVRLGVLIAFVGMMTGFLMTGVPSPAQQAQMAAGEQPTTFGAHSVGVEDGGPGLPFVGWSTEGGDLPRGPLRRPARDASPAPDWAGPSPAHPAPLYPPGSAHCGSDHQWAGLSGLGRAAHLAGLARSAGARTRCHHTNGLCAVAGGDGRCAGDHAPAAATVSPTRCRNLGVISTSCYTQNRRLAVESPVLFLCNPGMRRRHAPHTATLVAALADAVVDILGRVYRAGQPHRPYPRRRSTRG